MEGIRVRGLVKRFGPVTALGGVDLDVPPGEVVALLGPNGSGKSTLIRILGTTVLPDEGTVTVDGIDVAEDPRGVCRRIGLMIGDERSFYWRLSGRQNLIFFAALHGLEGDDADRQAENLLAQVGLGDAADRGVLGYSSGMRARLALARALLASPPLLLLDEPTHSLDPLAASGFRDLAVELANEGGAGILFATHDLHEAAAVATRVVVLSEGHLVYEQSTAGMDATELEAAFLKAVQK